MYETPQAIIDSIYRFPSLSMRASEKMLTLGPSIESDVETKGVYLIVPHPIDYASIADFWVNAGGEWIAHECHFRWDITGKRNQGEWLTRATKRFNEFWKGDL